MRTCSKWPIWPYFGLKEKIAFSVSPAFSLFSFSYICVYEHAKTAVLQGGGTLYPVIPTQVQSRNLTFSMPLPSNSSNYDWVFNVVYWFAPGKCCKPLCCQYNGNVSQCNRKTRVVFNVLVQVKKGFVPGCWNRLLGLFWSCSSKCVCIDPVDLPLDLSTTKSDWHHVLCLVRSMTLIKFSLHQKCKCN